MAIQIGILGYGQIGHAIEKLYLENKGEHPVLVMKDDIDQKEINGYVDVLHVCIPYKDRNDFLYVVEGYLNDFIPEITIIHSTVGIGTTETLSGKHPVVHSPMRGVHPDLYGGLMHFDKYIGADTEQAGAMAEAHLREYGVKTFLVNGSRNTEAGKLWSTSQYGFNIIMQKHIKSFCDAHGLDFNVVYTEFNQSYNRGYERLNNDKYRKYVLDHMDGEIGGHCIVPNWEIMFNEHGDLMCDMMLDMNEMFKESK